jgi:hypothetical protein
MLGKGIFFSLKLVTSTFDRATGPQESWHFPAHRNGGRRAYSSCRELAARIDSLERLLIDQGKTYISILP